MTDKFDITDMAFLGGVVGFVDEALAEENQFQDEDGPDPLDVVSNNSVPNDVNIRLFRNGHPDLYEHIVRTISNQQKEWAKEREARESIQPELDALAKCEKLLEEE
jgi:hypothetical protein